MPPSKPHGPTGDAPLSRTAIIYMALLALQFGLQPSLTKRYTPSTTHRSSIVLMQEATKFLIAGIMLLSTHKFKAATHDWNVRTWLKVAGLPSALYAVQNMAALMAYQQLNPLTFNVLNQTKTLSAAVCCYIIMGRQQSLVQMASLVLLLVSTLVMEGVSMNTLSTLSLDLDGSARHFTHGIVPIAVASFISGLAGALTQYNLQTGNRDSFLFSMELCVGSCFVISASMLVGVNDDGMAIHQHGFFHNWTLGTLIPILTNAVGGLLVGMVTKYAGSVRKGFALVFGIFLSGMIQTMTSSDGDDVSAAVTFEDVTGGTLAAIALYLHSTYPCAPSIQTTTSKIHLPTDIPSPGMKNKKLKKARKED